MPEDLTLQEISAMMPMRPPDGHKGVFGHLIVVAGSRGFTGAAGLVCKSACRSGVGLVTAAIPETLSNLIASSLVEPMTLALPATDADTLDITALDPLLEFVAGKSALVVGPGLSTHRATARLVRRLHALRPLPLVVDADGLNALSAFPERLVSRGAAAGVSEVIFTPHPGEMSRLSGFDTAALQQRRAEIASQYATLWSVTLVLKGHGTLVASPDGRVRRNPTGNHGMATGGAGDVLTGIIGAMLAQGVPAFDAACIGVFVHGLAGDIAARDKTPRALIASDIIEALPDAWRAVERQDSCPN